jgi:hypothetical protein
VLHVLRASFIHCSSLQLGKCLGLVLAVLPALAFEELRRWRIVNLMPNMQGEAAAAVDDAMGTAINSRPDDVGQQTGSKSPETFSADDQKA